MKGPRCKRQEERGVESLMGERKDRKERRHTRGRWRESSEIVSGNELLFF